MRIAYLNRGRSHEGGDLVALDATMAALGRLGVECVETGWDVERIKAGEFDLCHLFHCNFDWCWGNYEAVQAASKPYVLTPVYYPGPLLSGITQQQLRRIVEDASCVLPFSDREANEIASEITTEFNDYRIIPNGTDPMFHNTSDAMKREGVLCVAARDDVHKNVAQVRDICESLRLPFTYVTGIPHDQLPPIYAAHRLFVNASASERMSLTTGEALCAGCRVVASHGNRGNEHYPELVVDNIHKDLIARSYHLPDWNHYPNAAARKLTWDAVAEKLLKVYEEVLR